MPGVPATDRELPFLVNRMRFDGGVEGSVEVTADAEGASVGSLMGQPKEEAEGFPAVSSISSKASNHSIIVGSSEEEGLLIFPTNKNNCKDSELEESGYGTSK